MANHLRQLRGGRVSFFLFMDTITAVTAMLIMVALMMTLYMGGSPVFPLSPSSSTAKPDELLAQAAQITLQNQAVRATLTSTHATPDTNRLRADIVSLQGQVISLSNDLARQDARLRQQETETREKVNQLVVAEHRQQIEEAKRLWDELKASNQLVQAASADLVEKTKDAEARLERAKREGSKIWLIPDAGGAAKQPLLVCLSRTNLVCERFNQPDSRRTIPTAAGERAFGEFLAGLRPDRDYIVFYLRPSGVNLFHTFYDLAKRAGFSIGLDAIEEDKQIVFRQPQAL